MPGSVCEIFGEHLGQPALEFAEDLLEATERDALGALLQTVQGRWGKAELAGKLRVSLLAASLFQEAGKLILQGLLHAANLGKEPIPDAE
jgi:hypothetical protein